MFAVEVLTISTELRKPISLAMDSLNGLQQEFHFAFPPDGLLAQAEVMQRERYSTTEIFAWLRKYREDAKGDRRHLILVVDGFLSSAKLHNIFGSHEAGEGLATFTTHDSGRFVHDQVRYIRYYLVRYGLSFLAPEIKSHAEARACFFDRKMTKSDLKLSIDSGGICDECRSQLTFCWTTPIKRAIEDMASLIAGDYPHALVMKGGGVKGLAFAGAMLELEDHFTFDVFAGTSAGSIAALLFAAKYSPRELETELSTLDFGTFRDASLPRAIINFVLKRGLYPGKKLSEWVEARLKTKLGATADVRMSDLPSRAVIYASSPGLGILTFDTNGERRETLAAFAARCSASIPYYFERQYVDGQSVYDGGLRENFPFEKFLHENKAKPTIGLYLTTPMKTSWFVLSDLINVAASGDDANTIRKHADKIVPIDPSPLKTTDFDLTYEDKELLISAGRSAAKRFLLNQKIDGGPSAANVQSAESRTGELRAKVARRRNRRL
ncbi:MAG: patatin-like phospholipase family protein [Pyrinomonadaceae bacterium]